MINEGITDTEDARSLSRYANKSFLDNDFEEVYTELSTKKLLEGGARK